MKSLLQSKSLQRDLGRWLLILTVISCLIGAGFASGLAYFRAKELQDDVLMQIATWVLPDEKGSVAQSARHFDDERIVIQSMQQRQPLRFKHDLGLGFHNIKARGDTWRVLVTNIEGQKYAIAQQIEVREELAEGSAMSAVLPILLFALMMYLGLRFIIDRRLHPIQVLAHELDQRDELQLTPIDASSLPSEITPFTSAINRLLRRTADSLQRQQRFIADAAHELRTPVAGLSILAENLQKSPSANEQVTLLQTGLHRLQSLVEQLLNLARLQADADPKLIRVEAHELLQQVVVDLYPLAEQKQLDLGVTENQALTLCDLDNGLWHIFQNSLSNAIRYTPEQGAIDVSLRCEGGELLFEVLDTGPGIDAKTLAHIFEPFHRGDDHQNQGNGLGLAICKQVADRAGGKLKLENRAEGGVRFSYRQEY